MTLLAANLAQNFDRGRHLGGPLLVSRAKSNSMISPMQLSQNACVSRDGRREETQDDGSWVHQGGYGSALGRQVSYLQEFANKGERVGGFDRGG